MRKYIIPLITILSLCSFISCVTMAESQDFKDMSAVHQVKMSKGEIYDKAMIYVATVYNSPKKVIQYKDKGQGMIVFNGAKNWQQPMNPYSVFLHYKTTIRIKDNKYKIEMSPLHWHQPHGGHTGSNFSKSMAEAYSA